MGTIRSDISSAHGAVPVDLSAADVVLSAGCRGLYIGATGDVIVDMAGQGTAITFKAVSVGVLPVQAAKVVKTGTTATDIVALY